MVDQSRFGKKVGATARVGEGISRIGNRGGDVVGLSPLEHTALVYDKGKIKVGGVVVYGWVLIAALVCVNR